MIRWGLAAAIAVFALDQASKWWVLRVLDLPALRRVRVLPFFDLTMVWNQGVTFGLLRQEGASGPWLLAGMALAVVLLLGLWMRRAERKLTALALGAIAGGAVGNVLDRIRFGAVVDFLHLHAYGYSWYVFNVADSAVVCGVAVLVLEGLFPGSKRPRRHRLQAGADRG
jgi:signal peptidase II